MHEPVTPSTTLAIILGAHDFPEAKELFSRKEAFLNSAKGFKCYLLRHSLRRKGFGLPNNNLLDLFDSDLSSAHVHKEIREWLERKTTGGTTEPRDLIVYYVGHGGFSEKRDYVLALRSTSADSIGPSSLDAAFLASTLKKAAPHLRQFLILDCCFAEEAMKDFQSAAVAVTQQQLRPTLSACATAMLMASPVNKPAISQDNERHTVFSGSLLKVLEEGVESDEVAFSFERLRALIECDIRGKYGTNAVTPPIFIPGPGQDPSTVRLHVFPNHGRTRPTSGGVYHALIDEKSKYCSEADREQAIEVSRLISFASVGANQQRQSLRVIGQRLARSGLRQILDLGSGFPLADHLHACMPPDTVVVYSDKDSRTCRIAAQILEQEVQRSNVYYLEADAANPEEGILDSDEVRGAIDLDKPVGIVFWGLSAFMPDEAIEHAAEVLYDWAPKGSRFVFQAQMPEADPESEKVRRLRYLYKVKLGVELQIRSLETYCVLLGPWNAQPDRFEDVSRLIGEPLRRCSVDLQDFLRGGGVGAGFFGTKA